MTGHYNRGTTGLFNHPACEYRALRSVLVELTADVHASRRLEMLGELRGDQGDVWP